MSDPLHKLRDLIASVENENESSDHREIYRYIERQVFSPKSPIVKQVPPLEVVVYAIHNILYPNLTTHRIPDLLDLLATVEFYRKRTLDYARNATIWNDYYKTANTVLTLSNEEEALLQRLYAKKDDMRAIYITLISSCCHLDLYLLWTASPPSISDFLIRFNQYYPTLNKNYTRESPRLFWSDLSPEEAIQVSNSGSFICTLARDTVKWAIDNAAESQTLYSTYRTKDFEKTFQRPCQDAALSTLVTFYTGQVTTASDKVQAMFPSTLDGADEVG